MDPDPRWSDDLGDELPPWEPDALELPIEAPRSLPEERELWPDAIAPGVIEIDLA